MASPATNVFTYSPTINQHIENVRTLILEGSGLKPEWIDFIKKDFELYSSLREAVKGLVKYYLDEKEGSLVIPADQTMILAALKYCKPAEVKVIILGHDPVKESDLATGLAISLPGGLTSKNISSRYGTSGISVVNVHEALEKAKITPGDSLNHEHWARRGVLLLNACLTNDPKNTFEKKSDGSDEIENPHFKHWKNFTCRLLQKLLRQNRNDAGPPIFVLCWGTHARDVKDYLKRYLQQGDTVVEEFDGDHSELQQQQLGSVVIASGHYPTFPGGDYGVNKFHTQAKNQFKAIRSQYSTLFDQAEEDLAAGVANMDMNDETS